MPEYHTLAAANAHPQINKIYPKFMTEKLQQIKIPHRNGGKCASEIYHDVFRA